MPLSVPLPMVPWSIVSSAPRPASSFAVVTTSCRCGTLLISTGSSASRVAHRMGSTAFFAPEICTSPCSGVPPSTRIFCMSGARPGRFFGRERLQGEGVDLAAHAFAERGVHHAMARQGQLAREVGADHGGFEMHAVLALHLRARAGEALFDQAADGVGVHRGGVL